MYTSKLSEYMSSLPIISKYFILYLHAPGLPESFLEGKEAEKKKNSNNNKKQRTVVGSPFRQAL